MLPKNADTSGLQDKRTRRPRHNLIALLYPGTEFSIGLLKQYASVEIILLCTLADSPGKQTRFSHNGGLGRQFWCEKTHRAASSVRKIQFTSASQPLSRQQPLLSRVNSAKTELRHLRQRHGNRNPEKATVCSTSEDHNAFAEDIATCQSGPTYRAEKPMQP